MQTAVVDEVKGFCDKCGVSAKIRAELLNGELLFCGHHAREVGTALVGASIRVYDPEGYMNIGRS